MSQVAVVQRLSMTCANPGAVRLSRVCLTVQRSRRRSRSSASRVGGMRSLGSGVHHDEQVGDGSVLRSGVWLCSADSLSHWGG